MNALQAKMARKANSMNMAEEIRMVGTELLGPRIATVYDYPIPWHVWLHLDDPNEGIIWYHLDGIWNQFKPVSAHPNWPLFKEKLEEIRDKYLG